MIAKIVTEKLANHMTNRLNNELIKPVVHTGVNTMVENLLYKIEQACAGSNGTVKEQLQVYRAQNAIMQYGEDLAI